MKKSDLMTGHIVEIRLGKLYAVMLNHYKGGIDILVNSEGWLPLYNYNEVMEDCTDNKWDIITVYESFYTQDSIAMRRSELSALWSRKGKKENLGKEIQRLEEDMKLLRKEYDSM